MNKENQFEKLKRKIVNDICFNLADFFILVSIYALKVENLFNFKNIWKFTKFSWLYDSDDYTYHRFHCNFKHLKEVTKILQDKKN
jgi:hypothetical protein